jgi:hypothetical protein
MRALYQPRHAAASESHGNQPDLTVHLVRCRLVDAAYEFMITVKFSLPGQGPPNAPSTAIAHVAPVLAEPDPDDLEGFAAETAAMAAAMKQSIEDQRALKKPDHELCEADLKRTFPTSVVLAELGRGSSAVLIDEARTPALRLLRLEAKCFKWWAVEGGVRPYFRALVTGIAAACGGAGEVSGGQVSGSVTGAVGQSGAVVGGAALSSMLSDAYDKANREILGSQMGSSCSVPEVFVTLRPANHAPTPAITISDDDG